MNKFTKRIAAVAATSALVLAGVALSASAASALSPATSSSYTFDLQNQSGATITSGSTTSAPMFYGVHINSVCPSPTAAATAGVALYNAAGTVDLGFFSAQTATTAEDGQYGSFGIKAADTQILANYQTASNATNPYVSVNSFATASTSNVGGTVPTSGNYLVRYLCFANGDSSVDETTDPSVTYFDYPITISGTTWTHTTPPTTTATSTSLSAHDNGNGTYTFTATVTPSAAGVAPATVTFANGGTGTTGTLCQANTWTSNTASCTTTGTLANGSYSVTAAYSGTTVGTVTYSTSTSTPFTFIVGAYPTTINPNGTANNVHVTLPTSTGALTLTGTVFVEFGTATYDATNNRFTSTLGSLASAASPLVVSDQRQIGNPTWSLQAKFTGLTLGTPAIATIPSTDLGWTPTIVAGAGGSNVVADAAVTPVFAGGTGLTAGQHELAKGDVPANSSNVQTKVYAPMSLNTAGNLPAGSYYGNVTVTLVNA